MVLATLDVSLHIGMYLFVYTGNFEVPISSLEYRLFCFPELYLLDMILHVYPIQGGQHQGTVLSL